MPAKVIAEYVALTVHHPEKLADQLVMSRNSAGAIKFSGPFATLSARSIFDRHGIDVPTTISGRRGKGSRLTPFE